MQLADRPVKSYVCIGPLTILYFYMHCIYFLKPIYYLLRWAPHIVDLLVATFILEFPEMVAIPSRGLMGPSGGCAWGIFVSNTVHTLVWGGSRCLAASSLPTSGSNSWRAPTLDENCGSPGLSFFSFHNHYLEYREQGFLCLLHCCFPQKAACSSPS